eukprot:2232765-Amphidinium_carterae.1
MALQPRSNMRYSVWYSLLHACDADKHAFQRIVHVQANRFGTPVNCIVAVVQSASGMKMKLHDPGVFLLQPMHFRPPFRENSANALTQ